MKDLNVIGGAFFLCVTSMAQTVTLVSPSQNELNVDKETVISVTFDRDINPTTVNANTFIVHCSQTGICGGTFSYNPETRTSTFYPEKHFSAGETITVTLTKGIKTQSGIPLIKSFQWSFTIETLNASGEFTDNFSYPAERYVMSIFPADINGDSFIDIVSAGHYSDSIYVYINDGHGNFDFRANYFAGENPRSVFAADLDKDGDMDIITSNPDIDSISILINDGNGIFAQPIGYRTDIMPDYVHSADLNGDGYMDLLVPSMGTGNVSIFINDGSGGFHPRINYPTASVSVSVFPSDLDNDGDMDFVCANGESTSDTISVLFNKGDGTFTGRTFYKAEYFTYAVTSADLNNDGFPDIAVTNYYHSSFSVFLNNGNGSFGEKNTYTAGIHPSSIVTSDINGDGFLDIVITVGAEDSLIVSYNDGNGFFPESKKFYFNGGPFSVCSADFDNDNDADIAFSSLSSKKIWVLFNDSLEQSNPSINSEFCQSGHYFLYDNYPNPFNQTTKIRYETIKAGFVNLKVYDITGREVAELVNKEQKPGLYEVIFDGRNLPGGIYFYCIKLGDKKTGKKMILAK